MHGRDVILAEIDDLSWSVLVTKKLANVRHNCQFSSSVLVSGALPHCKPLTQQHLSFSISPA